MYRLFLSMCFIGLGACSTLSAQMGVIVGFVKNESNEALPGIKLTLRTTTAPNGAVVGGAIADKQGAFTIPNVPAGGGRILARGSISKRTAPFLGDSSLYVLRIKCGTFFTHSTSHSAW